MTPTHKKEQTLIETRTEIDGDIITEGDLSFEPEGKFGVIVISGSIQCKNLSVKADGLSKLKGISKLES